MSDKPRFIQCICTGECPGFKTLDLWKLMNYVRNELPVEYAIVHPQLCVDDGDRFLSDYIKPDRTYIIGACDPKMQRKMFRDAFESVGGDYARQVIPLDLRNMTTEQAAEKVRETVEKITAKEG